MFTDWTQTAPSYFYQRGAIFGFVLASIIWRIIAPAISRLQRKDQNRRGREYE